MAVSHDPGDLRNVEHDRVQRKHQQRKSSDFPRKAKSAEPSERDKDEVQLNFRKQPKGCKTLHRSPQEFSWLRRNVRHRLALLLGHETSLSQGNVQSWIDIWVIGIVVISGIVAQPGNTRLGVVLHSRVVTKI